VPLVVTVQGAQTVEVHSNAPVSAPDPLVSAVQMMVVVIATVQMPVGADSVPPSSRPALINAQPVSMAANLAVGTTPDPPWALVVVIATVEVPVRPHPAPVALVIPVESTQAIQVHTNAPEAAPHPFHSAVQVMIVPVPPPQVPVTAHAVPTSTIPAPVDPKSVLMASHSAVSIPPEPPRSFEIMVLAPQMPVCPDTTPMSLIVTIQGAQTVKVNTNAAETTPPPLNSPVEMMIVVVPTVEVPVAADGTPVRTSPTLVHPQAVPVTTDLTVAVDPEPP